LQQYFHLLYALQVELGRMLRHPQHLKANENNFKLINFEFLTYTRIFMRNFIRCNIDSYSLELYSFFISLLYNALKLCSGTFPGIIEASRTKFIFFFIFILNMINIKFILLLIFGYRSSLSL